MEIIERIFVFLGVVNFGCCLECYTCSSGGFGKQSKDCPSSGPVNTFVLRPSPCSGVCYTRNNAQNIGEVIHGCASKDNDVTLPEVMLSPDCYEWSGEMWCTCNTSGCNRFPLGYVPSEDYKESAGNHKEHSRTYKEQPYKEHIHEENLHGYIINDTIMMDNTRPQSNVAVTGVTVDMTTEPVTKSSIQPKIATDLSNDVNTTKDTPTEAHDTSDALIPYTTITSPAGTKTIQTVPEIYIQATDTDSHVTSLTEPVRTSTPFLPAPSESTHVFSNNDDITNDIEHLKAVKQFLQSELEMDIEEKHLPEELIHESSPPEAESSDQLFRQDDQPYRQEDQPFRQEDQPYRQEDQPYRQEDQPFRQDEQLFNNNDNLLRSKINKQNIVDDYYDNGDSYRRDQDDQRYQQQHRHNTQWHWQQSPIFGQQSVYPNNYNYQNQRRSRFQTNRYGNNILGNGHFQNQRVGANVGHFQQVEQEQQGIQGSGNQVDNHSNNELLQGNSKDSQIKETTTKKPPKRTTSKADSSKIDGNHSNKKRKHMFHKYNILNGEIYARNPAGTQNDRKASNHLNKKYTYNVRKSNITMPNSANTNTALDFVTLVLVIVSQVFWDI